MRHHPKRLPCSLRHQQCRYNRTVERNPTTPTVESGILQTPRQCSILLRREPAPNRHLRLCRIRRFDVDDDVRMQNIFIFGTEKQKLYVGKNPRIANSASWINPATEQGVQYINADDIYFRIEKGERVYRYWKCHGNHSTSTADERFSHFSEDERLW